MKAVKHPNFLQAQADVAVRFRTMRSRHDTAVERMWMGHLIAEFTDADFELLRGMDYLSPRDEALIRAAKR